MKIQKIDFNNEGFLTLIKSYLWDSEPIPKISQLRSVSAKNVAIDQYIEILSELGLSIAALNDDNEYLLFVFINTKEEGLLDLEFAFPNSYISSNTRLMRMCFYSLCLYAMGYLKINNMHGTLRRQNKKNGFKFFLKRYIKAISYTENDEHQYDSVYLTKESILKHREQLKSKSNWD